MVGVRHQHDRAPVWIRHCRLPVASATDSSHDPVGFQQRQRQRVHLTFCQHHRAAGSVADREGAAGAPAVRPLPAWLQAVPVVRHGLDGDAIGVGLRRRPAVHDGAGSRHGQPKVAWLPVALAPARHGRQRSERQPQHRARQVRSDAVWRQIQCRARKRRAGVWSAGTAASMMAATTAAVSCTWGREVVVAVVVMSFPPIADSGSCGASSAWSPAAAPPAARQRVGGAGRGTTYYGFA